MNSIHVLQPYKLNGVWVFEDPAVGLEREPFTGDADLILDLMSSEVAEGATELTLLFSADPFPQAQFEMSRCRFEAEGYWYFSREFGRETWLGPSLFKYFEAAPEKIFLGLLRRQD